MTFSALKTLFALAPPQPGQPTQPVWVNFVPIALMMVIFYFILIRPQHKKAKEQAELLKSIRPGDKVLTNGGIIGVVVGVKDKSVSIRSADTKLEVLKSAVTEITEKAAGAADS